MCPLISDTGRKILDENVLIIVLVYNFNGSHLNLPAFFLFGGAVERCCGWTFLLEAAGILDIYIYIHIHFPLELIDFGCKKSMC